MYKIKRRYQVKKKQPWVVDLLLQINPKYFALYEAKDDCLKSLMEINKTIRSLPVRWRRGSFSLSHIRTILLLDDKIEVKYKSGKECMTFYIEELN